MRPRVTSVFGVGAAAICCLLVLLAPKHASAATGINQEVSFEGKVVTAAGINIPDGVYNMEFKIYTAAGTCNPATGAGCTLGWTEDWLRNNGNGVTFTSGTFQVNLDAVAANNFSGIDFNTNPLYLSLTLGNTNATCTPFSSCSPDTEMKPFILFTSTPYALNSGLLNGLSSTAFGQLTSNQTWTGTNTFQPTTNITGLIVKQTSFASPSADIFDVQTANGSSVIQVTGPSANTAAVSISSLGANAITLNSGGALTFTGAAASVWSTSSGTLTVESASGSIFTASAQGTGQSNFGTAGTGGTALGNSGGSTELNGPLYGSSTGGVMIGSGTASATPLLLDLNNSSLQGAEAAGDCSTTINSGAIYYSAATASSSTTTNELRGCIDGKWTDIVTADQLGLLLFGVVQSSGLTAGDIVGITGFTNSPCKVTWASATSVSVAPCTAYSGGRKVVITSAVTISGLGTLGSVNYQDICLDGTNGAPQATTGAASDTAAVPTWNAGAPILCLATVKLNTTPAITNIYDTRIFVTSIKQYVTSSSAVAPGMMVVDDTATPNGVKTTTTAATAGVRGVVAVGNSAGSTNTVNAIIVTGGPAFVKDVTIPPINGDAAKTSTTAGYAEAAAALANSTYTDLGLIVDVGSTAACSAATNCQFSMLVDVLPY